MEDVKQPLEAGIMCTIDMKPFICSQKIPGLESCHITNNDIGLYNATDINESIQGSSGIMPATKKGEP